VEFFELIRQHLKPGGILSQWLPNSRLKNQLMKVFPYVVAIEDYLFLQQ